MKPRLSLAGLLAGLLVAGQAQTAPALEYDVKATYLYKFFAFADWPPGALGAPGEPVALCIVGKDPFGPVIDQAGDGQRVGDHPIEVRRLRQASRGSGCRLLYMRAGDGQSIAQALAAVAGEPVLTVTDGAPGGAIQFVVKSGRVRFAIDQPAASANGLTLSSKLLAVAITVRR